METRQIAAVVLIVVIIAGVGIGVWLFLPAAPLPYGTVLVGQLVTPGAPDGISSDQIIIVGILDPMTEIQGIGAWKGAYLACDEINSAGGVTVGGTTYYFGLVSEDTFEADPSLDLTKGTAAATKIVTEDNAQFIIGGFRSEALLAYQEIIMDENMLLFGTGASTDIFCQKVLDNYARYKYFFRSMPINSTSLASSLFRYLLSVRGYLSAALNQSITKVALLREGIEWTEGMSAFLNSFLPNNPYFNFTIVHEIAFPMTAEAADFATYWQQIDAAGAQITVPMISARGGILMTTQYALVQPKTFLAGIDVMAQLDTYWNETGGACQYEVLMQSTLRTNKTTKTIPFWDSFTSHYGSEPLYTAVGSYDAMYTLAAGIDRAQSLVSDDIIPHLEAMNITNPFEGAGGNAAFTESHDLLEGYIGDTIYSVTLFTQWQADGAKEVVTTAGLIYPDSIVTATLSIPPWGINT